MSLLSLRQAERPAWRDLSQTDAGASRVSRTWTRRSTSSWIASLDCLGGPVVRLPVRGALAERGRPRSRPAALRGGPDGSGHGLLAQFLGQFADLGFGVAAVAAEGLEERQSALFGPAGHRLGRHVQEVGHLAGPQVARIVGCGLAAGLGCHGASLRCRTRQRDRARWTGCPCDDDGHLAAQTVSPCWMPDEQDDYQDQTK